MLATTPQLPYDIELAAATLCVRRRTATAVARRGANYIPLRYPDLRDRLVEGHPEIFNRGLCEGEDDEAGAATKIRFYRLAELMSLRNLLRWAGLRGTDPRIEAQWRGSGDCS